MIDNEHNDQKAALTGELRAELSFWQTFMSSDRFIQNWCRAAPNPELELEVDFFVQGVAREIEKQRLKARILDVGSGPVSILNGSFFDVNVKLIAVDRLADEYATMWVHDFKDQVCVPETCAGEDLLKYFGPRMFDVTHIRNALHQMTDPLAVVQQMIQVTKPGGYIVVHGFEDDAHHEDWKGLHKWNVRWEAGDLVVESNTGDIVPLISRFESLISKVRLYRKTLEGERWWVGLIAEVR